VGHRLRPDSEVGQRVEDQRAARDHPRIDHDQGVAVTNERDSAADVPAGVASMEDMDRGHRRMLDGRAAPGETVATDGMPSVRVDRAGILGG
jgi:hypothetical protein